MKQNGKLKRMMQSAMFAALIAVMTAFIKVNTGINNGYLHFGDAMVYLAACLLPQPYAIAAAAIGGGLADCLAGAAIWALPTAVIKALNTLPFSAKKSDRILTRRNGAMGLVSGIITIVGYLIAESLLYTPASAVLSVPFSLIQASGSLVLFWVIGAALDGVGLKKRLQKGNEHG